MNSILIKNATIVNEGRNFRGDLLIKDEFISAIGSIEREIIPHGCKIIEASGLLLLPGIINDHVHFREPGLTHKGDIFSETRAAVAGGVTSFMDMPNTVPQTVTIDLLNEKYKLGQEKSLINYSFYLGGTNSNLKELMKADPQTVCGIKLFLGSSTGNMLLDDPKTLKEIFSKSSLLIACHCEDGLTINKNSEIYLKKYEENIPIKFHPLIRSRDACLLTSSFAVNLAREHNTRLHILHISTADELRLFTNELVLKDKRITGEACVHHLWFDDADYEKHGNFIKWNPAIKTKYDRDSLIKGVNNNLIDIVATDHAPHTIAEKSNSYFKAPSGGPLVQHSLPVMMEMYHRGFFTLEKIVEKMCHNPSVLFKIRDRGFIREGYRADICLVDPQNPWTVDRENILYKCGWSPFEGLTFHSKVITTIVNGTIVYDNGTINENYRGERLEFNRK
jgi:dihydroorotase